MKISATVIWYKELKKIYKIWRFPRVRKFQVKIASTHLVRWISKNGKTWSRSTEHLSQVNRSDALHSYPQLETEFLVDCGYEITLREHNCVRQST